MLFNPQSLCYNAVLVLTALTSSLADATKPDSPRCQSHGTNGPMQVTPDCVGPLYHNPIYTHQSDESSPVHHRKVSGYFNVRVPHKPPVPTLVPPRRGISSTAPHHKEKPGSATAPENKSLNRASSRVDRTTNTKKSKKEPIPLAEIKRIQKMSVEELKEVILSAGYELPDCTCTWPDDYGPEGEFMERMEKSIKDRARREQREQREKGRQSEQKGSRRGGR